MFVPSGRHDAGLRDTRTRSIASAVSLVLAALVLVAFAAQVQARSVAHPPHECARSEEPHCIALRARVRAAEIARLRASITYRILGSVQYPPQAAMEGEGGMALVHFVLLPSGRLTDIGIIRSSGSAALDRAARQAVQLASPIPLGPNGLPKKKLVFTVPISFNSR
ncbi:energy transducer TonB family protein [Tardiphaga sp. 839_C3_N1_4]|uniref:energy transducer TonB family protein n=1 Tax=Tardiphaga sp. 839_C3_N1_4 TaxID=3240761 RepID=UPI003F220932